MICGKCKMNVEGVKEGHICNMCLSKDYFLVTCKCGNYKFTDVSNEEWKCLPCTDGVTIELKDMSKV